MMNRMIQPEDLFSSSSFGFSQVVVSEGKKLVFCSGQTSCDRNLNIVGKGDLKLQLETAFNNVRIALKAAGATVSDVVSIRIYIVNYKPDYWDLVQSTMIPFFGSDCLPTSSLLGVSSLISPDLLCEIEVIASIEK